MKIKPNAPRFFLGVNSPQGFVSRFDRLAGMEGGWRTLIIKGGPGGGKSTLLGRVYEVFAGRFDNIEIIHCSSDMDSVDAVIMPSIKAAVIDGTPPHANKALSNNNFMVYLACKGDEKANECGGMA